MAEYTTLNEAMDANDELAEARLRYQLLAEAFEENPKLRGQINAQLVSAKAEISRLRALAPKSGTETAAEQAESGKVVAFDAGRFRKSG
ncbi:hypothetical protein [Mycolicibacterium fortuitum]|uniref:hypothetical protein n=1 Tax=Mycolicibacterium fortuitum TaxID=1766 RepID=UPI00148FFCDE|nr:hypothetical protein [Mycolicibacterium fortuitum]